MTSTSHWDETGLNPISDPPADFEDSDIDEAAELIKDWFFDNFEDPAQSTPYDSREGGYIYIHGGPYESRDIIENVFADSASQEVITAAIELVEHDGTSEWAPHASRVQGPDDDEVLYPEDIGANPRYLHHKLVRRIRVLEAALDALPPPHAPIGHNMPPEPIEYSPLTHGEVSELRKLLGTLKDQPPSPSVAPPEASRAITRIQELGKKIGSYMAEKADIFVTAAVKKVADNVVPLALVATFWSDLQSKLSEVIAIAVQWLETISRSAPF